MGGMTMPSGSGAAAMPGMAMPSQPSRAPTAQTADLSAAHADMTALADNRIEQLRAAATYRTADTLQLVAGGNLVTPTAPYTTTVVERGRTYILTWVVTAGPGGTRNVTVRVRPAVDDVRTPARLDFTTLIQLVTAGP